MASLDDGLHLFVKRDCPTCQQIVPVIRRLASSGRRVRVYSQDDPAFPEEVERIDDSGLEHSFGSRIEIVPTLLQVSDGAETHRVFGWNREEWEALTGIGGLGDGLPENQPGCGSKSMEPYIHATLRARYGSEAIDARPITLSDWDDPIESCFDRGWSDGLPLVPPTDARVLRMLDGTSRDAGEIVGVVPPNNVPCTVEKVAVSAVMAGCKPEYLPVVIAALEAVLEPQFAMHGLLCTTYFSGPVIVVNGPIARAIGMNSGANALGQGNRANSTIGRALQLIIRNVGGGKPGGIDRSCLGNPGKLSFCFAEDESDRDWEPLHAWRGLDRKKNAVTLFHGDGVTSFCDQRSRTADDLCTSMAQMLETVGHPKLAEWCNAILVLSPEHYGIFKADGWDRRRIQQELLDRMTHPAEYWTYGARGLAEGTDIRDKGKEVCKFWRDHGLLIVRAGGEAGLFSGIIGGWTGGRHRDDIQPVTREIG